MQIGQCAQFAQNYAVRVSEIVRKNLVSCDPKRKCRKIVATQVMMRNFLGRRKEARDLDKNEFKRYFPQRVKKADFLLFDDSVVCEVKEIKTVQMEQKAEKLWRKGALPENVFMREILASISSVLRNADAQVADTKKFLKLEHALGLVIVENLMPIIISGPMLFAAADKEMLAGLHNVDCTLCLDLVNKYTASDGKAIHFAQLLRRPDERSERLSRLLLPVVREFCKDAGAPWIEMGAIKKARLVWVVDNIDSHDLRLPWCRNAGSSGSTANCRFKFQKRSHFSSARTAKPEGVRKPLPTTFFVNRLTGFAGMR